MGFCTPDSTNVIFSTRNLKINSKCYFFIIWGVPLFLKICVFDVNFQNTKVISIYHLSKGFLSLGVLKYIKTSVNDLLSYLPERKYKTKVQRRRCLGFLMWRRKYLPNQEVVFISIKINWKVIIGRCKIFEEKSYKTSQKWNKFKLDVIAIKNVRICNDL